MLFKNKSPRLTPEAQLYHTRYHKAQSRRSQTLCRFHSRRDSSEREYLIALQFRLTATNLSNGFENCKDCAGFFAEGRRRNRLNRKNIPSSTSVILPFAEPQHYSREYSSHKKHPPYAECLEHPESPADQHVQGHKCDES